MKIRLTQLLFLLFSTQFINAQNYAGYRSGNYTGVNAVFFNPANIADSRYRWDINLVSANATFANNYAALKSKGFFQLLKGNDIDSALITRNTGKDANLLADVDIFGPSFMFSANAKNSFAITTRTRAMSNLDRVPAKLLNAAENDGEDVTFPTSFSQESFSISSHNWAEVGLSYARVLQSSQQHFFKAGITVKYLAGFGAGYFALSDIKGTLDKTVNDDPYLRGTTGSINYGSAGINGTNDFKFKINGSGIGADLGFVYENRPAVETDEIRKNKYKYKLEIAVHDIGAIRYKTANNKGNYSLNTSLNPNGQDTLMLTRFENIGNFDELNAALNAASPMISTSNSDRSGFNFTLPASVTVAGDYHIKNWFYLNLAGMFAMNKGTGKGQKTHAAHYVLFTPRYEGKAFGAYLPVGLNSLSGFNAGISLRGGPFFIGSGSIISTMIGKTKQADFHMGLRFGMLQKNRKQKAIETDKVIPAAAADSDGDGIADTEDKCPSVTGVAKYNGCPIPDTDGDGINDEEDKCVTVAGVARYNGCPIPDTDGDGINDEEDKCIDKPGIKENQGCPEIKKEVIERINYAAKNVFFATGSYKLLPKSYKALNEVAALMKTDASLKLQIDGHTDAQGDNAKNQALSENRAAAVKAYLAGKGVDAERMLTNGYGEDKPVADNETAAGRAKNRRTEMSVSNF